VLEADRIAYCFSLAHELPDVEFKGPGKGRDKPLFGRIVRAAMALTNKRGGGTLIIGVAEAATGLNFDGLSPEQLLTWKYEDIASGLNSFTSSPIEFDRQMYEHNGRTFLILDIHEFASVPIMCVKDYPDPANPGKLILRKGAFYVRTPNKPESAEMLTSEEVRILFELAKDKAVQSFVTLTKLAGINIAPKPEDKEQFARQLQDWDGPILKEIRSRGYWDVRIRPVTFQQERLPLSELRQVLIRAHVNYRGWELPYIVTRMPDVGTDWISLENQQQNGLQSWRFFQSGQFTAALGFLDDWNEKLPYDRYAEETRDKLLSILDVVFYLSEIFGMAARLATSDVYRDESCVVIDLTLCKVEKRRLYGRGVYEIFSIDSYTTAAQNIPYSVTLAKEDVIGRPQELAREAAVFFFERFGWNPSTQLLTSMQAQIGIPA
jgi:hypothetical protein